MLLMKINFIKYKLNKDGLNKTMYKIVRFLISEIFHAVNSTRLRARRISMPKSYIKEINGYKMFLDLKRDKGISQDLYLRGIREGNSIEYLLTSGVLKPGDTALDVGANIGYYALLESKIVGPQGRVYALEPVEESYEKLIHNINLNKSDNIEHCKIALGNKNGVASIHVGEKRNWSSIEGIGSAKFTGVESVDMLTGVDFLKDKKIPNFIRMDTEGYEYAIIEGLAEVLKRGSRVAVHIEVHPDIMTQEQTKSLMKNIRDCGFQKAVVIHEPYSGWLDRKYKIRPIITWLTKKIGDTEKLGKTEEKTISELEEIFIKEERQLRVVFIKNNRS